MGEDRKEQSGKVQQRKSILKSIEKIKASTISYKSVTTASMSKSGVAVSMSAPLIKRSIITRRRSDSLIMKTRSNANSRNVSNTPSSLSRPPGSTRISEASSAARVSTKSIVQIESPAEKKHKGRHHKHRVSIKLLKEIGSTDSHGTSIEIEDTDGTDEGSTNSSDNFVSAEESNEDLNEADESSQEGEDEEEDDLMAEEVEDELKGPSEEDEKLREELINRYFKSRKEYLHIRKRNAYLQDRLHQICVRKGFIGEPTQSEGTAGKGGRGERTKKRKQNVFIEKLKHHLEETQEDVEEDEEPNPDSPDPDDMDSILLNSDTNYLSTVLLSKFPSAVSHNQMNQQKAIYNQNVAHHQETVDNPSQDPYNLQLNPDQENPNADVNTGTAGFRAQKRVMRYNKVIRHIHHLERNKQQIAAIVDQRIDQLKDEHTDCRSNTNKFFMDFMLQVRTYSYEAINSNSGKHLDPRETEEYITELTKLFTKLCQTTLEFYKNWHSLNLELKHLEEFGANGEQSMEYEHLCGENVNLREKVEYQELELDKTRGKITHAIQLLAHFQEKEFQINENLEDRNCSLHIVNQRVQKLMALRDTVTVKINDLKKHEKILKAKTQLLDHPKLLKDYEETIKNLSALKLEKSKIREQIHLDHITIGDLKKQIERVKISGVDHTSSSTSQLRKSSSGGKKSLKLGSVEKLKRKLDTESAMEMQLAETNSNVNIIYPTSLSRVLTISPSLESQPQAQEPQQEAIKPKMSQPEAARLTVSNSNVASIGTFKKKNTLSWNWKTQRLLELLELRHHEPWKQVRDKLEVMTPALGGPSTRYRNVTRIPC